MSAVEKLLFWHNMFGLFLRLSQFLSRPLTATQCPIGDYSVLKINYNSLMKSGEGHNASHICNVLTLYNQ